MNDQSILEQEELWAGCTALESGPHGITPWRGRPRDQSLYDPRLVQRMKTPAGVRLAMRSNTSSLTMQVRRASEALDPGYFDLVIDGEFFQRVALSTECGEVAFSQLPSGDHLLEVYFPLFGEVSVSELAVDTGATVQPFNDRRPRWITHGSSISMCRSCEYPTTSWPALVAQQCGLNHTNLGYGGQCKVETLVARLISSQPADGISVCLGINVHAGDLSPRTFRAAAAGFLLTIREGHPDTPLVVCSPIFSESRESNPGVTGLTLQSMRADLESLASDLRDRGDKNIHYIDGLTLLGKDDAHLMPDGLHPGREGCRVLADNFVRLAIPRLGFSADKD